MKASHFFIIASAGLTLAFVLLFLGLRQMTDEKLNETKPTFRHEAALTKENPAQTPAAPQDDYTDEIFTPAPGSQTPEEIEEHKIIEDAFITPYPIHSGKISTILKTAFPAQIPFQDGVANVERIFISDIAVDGQNHIFLFENLNRRVYKLTPDGKLSITANNVGGTITGKQNYGDNTENYFGAVDGNGNIYVSDSAMNTVFKITPDGKESVFAGNGREVWNPEEDGITAAQSAVGSPQAIITLPASADSSAVFIISGTDDNLRLVMNGDMYLYSKGQTMGMVNSIARMPDNDGVILADSYHNRIVKVDRNKKVSVLLSVTEDPYAANLVLKKISRITADKKGNIFILDEKSSAIFMLDPEGKLHFVGGNRAEIGPARDGDQSYKANFDAIQNIKTDNDGNLCLVDKYNTGITKITF